MSMFKMKRPCDQCPFRHDVRGFLSEDRATEIADALLSDQTFSCHKTVDYSNEDEDGFSAGDTHNSQHCAGATIMLEHMEQPNQMMRWMERLGAYDRRQMEMDAPVFTDAEDFIQHHAEAEHARRRRVGLRA
jgi:hypothetical protein